MVTFVSIETRRCAPLAALFCSSYRLTFSPACLLQPKIRRYFLHSILIWTLLQPTSSNYSHTYITNMAVTSSKFAKNSGELRHSFCGAFLCLLFAFLQVESVGGWVDRGQCHCSTHVAGYSPLSPFINTLTYYLSSFPHNNARAEKIPISKAKSSVQSKPQKSTATMNVTVSPTTTTEDEVIALRAENKVLRQALNAVEDTATEQLKKSFELVWFARNRCKCTRMCMHWSLLRHDIFCLCQLATSRNQT